MKCPFCNPEVIRNQMIYESETEYVIYNIRPANKGQCLVIPKRHVRNIRELTDEEAINLIKTVKIVSEKLNYHLKPDGFNYGFNEGSSAGQTLEHLHFHIMPRYKGDGIREFHVFHRHPDNKRDLSDKEIEPFVAEFRALF